MTRKLNNTLVVLGGVIVILVATPVIIFFTREVLHLGSETTLVQTGSGFLVGYLVSMVGLLLWRGKYDD